MNPTITQFLEDMEIYRLATPGTPIGIAELDIKKLRTALKIAVEALEASCDPATHGWTAGKMECVQHKALSRIQAVIEGKA